MESKGWKKMLRKYKALWISGGVLLVLATVCICIFVIGYSGITITAQATTHNEKGRQVVLPESTFLIESKDPLTLEELEERLTVRPEIPYSLEETAPNTFVLTPLKYLEMGATYTFSAGRRLFRFTIMDSLSLVNHFPADGGQKVPVDCGIEFVFNQDVDIESLRDSFAVNPPVEGEFTYGNGRYVFYPLEDMRFETQYTVTLYGSVESKNGASLGGDVVFSFTTMSEREKDIDSAFSLSEAAVNTLASETPLLEAYIDSEYAESGAEVDVSLHAFEDWESFYDTLWKNKSLSDAGVVSTGQLREYASFSLKPVDTGSSNRRVLQFPELLPEGWYIADLSMEIEGVTLTRQVFMQVSDLSVFTMTMDQNLLVWINDAATGQPVENAVVEMSGAYNAKGTTGADGTASISNGVPNISATDPDPYGYNYGHASGKTIFTVTSGERTFVGLSSYSNYHGANASPEHTYMSYLFTDRTIYRTSDTIMVWGMVRPRYADTPMPESVTLSLDNVSEQVVTLAGDGTFVATLSHENIASGYRSLILKMGNDARLTSNYLNITDFVKPVYTASTSAEKPVYLSPGNEEMFAKINVSMFDGTPASSFHLSFDSSNVVARQGAASLVTDSIGDLRIPLRYTGDSVNSWYPRSYYYSFYSNEAESENFYQNGNVYIIHRDLMLKGKPEKGSAGMSLEVTTNRVDISGIEASDQLWEKDALKGAALSVPVQAEIHNIYYEKIKTGTHYDFINRTSVDSYRYERVDTVVDTISFTTRNGAHTLTNLPLSDNKSCYYVVLRAQDSQNRTVESTVYLGSYYNFYGSYDDGVYRYELTKQAGEGKDTTWESYGDLYYDNESSYFADEESVTFRLYNNDEAVENFTGRILYSVVQASYTETGVSSKEQITLPFDEKLVPNYLLTGAYFDGKRIFSLDDTYMYFDSDKRKLEVVLETDQDVYSPADSIQVTATVVESDTGQPAPGASVLLSVVDEAVFSLNEQSIDILGSMYQSVFFPNVHKYTSYTQYGYGGGGAEMGGGGGDELRKDFVDTACFSALTTGADGKASFSFTLPDNITSWRLTSLSLTGNNHAGSTKTNVSATKEFYVMPIVNEALIEGDSFAVGLRSAGVAVADSDTVRYQVQITGNGVDKTLECTSAVRSYASLDFGSLPQGDYTVTVQGDCGRYWDGVELPFTVTSSGVEVSLVKSFNLKDGISVDPLRYPVTISFYSESTRTYNEILRSVQRGSRGGRADMRIARKYIALEYERQGIRWYDSAALEDSLSDINGNYSPLMLFPYSDSDYELTVKAHLAAPELVGNGSLSWIRAGSDNGDVPDPLACLSQSLAEPGLDNYDDLIITASQMLEEDRSLRYADKIYLTMALFKSGEKALAQQWYEELVTANLQELTGISGKKANYIEVASESASAHDCTAAASMLATMMEKPEAEYLARYLAEKKSKYEPYILEQLYFMTMFKPSATDSAQFSYVRGGAAETVALDGTTTISFNKEQFAEADFKQLSGDVYADVYYIGAPGDESDASQNLIGFTKKVEAVSGTFEPGALVKITLTPDFSALDSDIGSQLLVIDDYIPTGMRYEKYKYEWSTCGWYLNSRQGQRIQFTMYNIHKQKQIVYYARCSTPGDYVVESAYISSKTGSVWGATDRSTVRIEP